jgi:hypothetical protein
VVSVFSGNLTLRLPLHNMERECRTGHNVLYKPPL